jgi:hypothetical protein
LPASVVKTKRDERLWREAKKQAAENGHGGEWDYIMGIYQHMRKREGAPKKKSRKPSKRTVKARKK